uniref:Uncharacterized protein n=1 Tax=Anguilla anguilla TaxID=7936 RepID=A0A0E9SAB4_ANGAN
MPWNDFVRMLASLWLCLHKMRRNPKHPALLRPFVSSYLDWTI